jgi:hypothetical protein
MPQGLQMMLSRRASETLVATRAMLVTSVLSAVIGVVVVVGCSGSSDRHNQPPEVVSVVLSPQPAVSYLNLTATVRGRDADGDSVHLSYEWLINDKPVSGVSARVLPSVHFRQGDRIVVRVTPSDDHGDGPVMESGVVVIENSPPIVTSVSLMPAPPSASEPVRTTVKGSDPDHDQIRYSYTWFNNGEEIFGQSGETLLQSHFLRGDMLMVEVVASDGKVKSQPVRSEPQAVRNSPPVIISSPPTGLADQNQYLYHVVAEDPDGDPVTYTLLAAPPGMQIDASTGQVSWQVTPEHEGRHSIEIAVADQAGAKMLQHYVLEITSEDGQVLP